jgi:hypothetical protein
MESLAGQLQPVIPGTPRLSPVRNSIPQVSLTMPTVQLPTNVQIPTTSLPTNLNGYLTPRGGNYSSRIQIQNQPTITYSKNSNFFDWLFSF